MKEKAVEETVSGWSVLGGIFAFFAFIGAVGLVVFYWEDWTEALCKYRDACRQAKKARKGRELKDEFGRSCYVLSMGHEGCMMLLQYESGLVDRTCSWDEMMRKFPAHKAEWMAQKESAKLGA